MDVGFVGLGRMGEGMAANLLAAGHRLTIHNRTPAKAEALAAKGARVAADVAGACRGEAVLTMLADDGALEAVAFGEGGLLAGLPAGAVHVSCSTIGPALSTRLAEAHAAAGQRYVAAPVFGRPEAAAGGQLFVVAAGDPATVASLQPLFDAIGQRTYVVSETPSHANVAKLGGNFLIASVMESLGEALALVGKAGIDGKAFVDLLTSSLFGARIYQIYGDLIASGRFEPAGFAAPLGLKDMRLVLGAAEDLRVPMPLASLLRDRFLALLAQGGESLDWSAIGRLPAKDAGVG